MRLSMLTQIELRLFDWEKVSQKAAALPPPTKERTKKTKYIIYVIAARRCWSDMPGRKHRDKAKAPHASKTQRGEVAYSSTSVTDDVAQEALSWVKPPVTNHHG